MRSRRATSGRRGVLAVALLTVASTLAFLPASPAAAAEGDMSTFAGSLGEGLATRVAQDSPGLALHGRTLYVAWNRPHPHDGAVVRAVNLDTGQERVVAGNGQQRASGDGGPATAAGIRHVGDLAVGPGGTLFLLDDYDRRVRRIDATGTITTVAGGGGRTGDGVRATDAYLGQVKGIAVDAAGRLYISGSRRIRQVSATGIMSTIAGVDDVPSDLGDGGPAIAATLEDPGKLAVDPSGNLYVADGPRVRSIDHAGVIRTVAGGGAGRFLADGDMGTDVQLSPEGLAFDPQGRLLLAAGHRIYRLDPDGRLRTVAGNGESAFRPDGSRAEPGDGRPATSVPLAPYALAADPAGNVYTAELGRALVRRIDPAGVITTVAGNGTKALGGDGGPALQAQFFVPTSMVFDRSGHAYIADMQNHRVRAVSPSGTISSLPQALGPGILAVDDAGRLFVATPSEVSRFDPDGSITRVAGGIDVNPVEGGLATDYRLEIEDIAADAAGNLYIADRRLRIWKVGADGTMVTVAGGGSLAPGDAIPATLAALEPTRVEVDRAGNLYVADRSTQRIWKVGAAGLLTSVAGTTRGFGDDGGPATDARLDFWGPSMALDGAGQLFVFDTGNRRVRRIDTRGVITTVAGSGEVLPEGAERTRPPTGTPATFTPLAAHDIAVRGSDLYLVDGSLDRVWKVSGVAEAAPSPTIPPPARALAAAAWGHNGYAQLGMATPAGRASAGTVPGMENVVAVAGGGFHSLGLRSDGTVWSWGLGHAGQLGTGKYVQTGPPGQVAGLQEVTAVAAGAYHSLALRSDGTVWAWGYNEAGQLGNGTTFHTAAPVRVAELRGVVALAAGSLHSLALRSDGTVWAWGLNHVGQLGTSDGGASIALKPVQVPGVAGARSIAAGWSHSLAVLADGRVAAWGWNTFGQLGDATTLDRRSPATVVGLPPVRSVTAGVGHTVALGRDGSVWTWGLDNFGQLARPAPVVSPVPAQVPGLSGVVSAVAGGHHTVALRTDGTMASWGWNEVGQLGDGTAANRESPVAATTLHSVRAVASGYAHSVAGAP